MFEYNQDGYLYETLYHVDVEGFLEEFCSGSRSRYHSDILNLLQYAKENNVCRVFVGGSFISKKIAPSDFDCLLVSKSREDVLRQIGCSEPVNIRYDVLSAAEADIDYINAFLTMMATPRSGVGTVGVVEIRLYQEMEDWNYTSMLLRSEYRHAVALYHSRTYIERNGRRGMLVPIHGLNTRADWLSSLTPLANSHGWLVAPFMYQNDCLQLIKRDGKVIEQFRNWVYALKEKYGVERVSVVAHSYGSYIITKYINSYQTDATLPVSVDSLILLGSIISADFNWIERVPQHVRQVLNVTSPNDGWVKRMKCAKVVTGRKLYGCAGVCGLLHTNKNVRNMELPILNHTNIFKNDFMESVMMPFINKLV